MRSGVDHTVLTANTPVMLILGLGLKAKIFGLGLGLATESPWPWQVGLVLGLVELALA